MKNNKKIITHFTDEYLFHIIIYLFSENKLISRQSIKNMKMLFSSLSLTPYEKSDRSLARLELINVLIDIRLKGISSPDLLLNSLDDINKFSDEIDLLRELIKEADCLTDDEIKYINSDTSDRITFIELYRYKDDITDLLDRLDDEESEERLSVTNEKIINTLSNLLGKCKKIKTEQDNSAPIDIGGDNFEEEMINVIHEIKQPSIFLKTGIKYLNELLDGGFEKGRCYVFLGLAGGGKSVLLLHIGRWIRNYNRNFKTSDPMKRPMVVYLTQENTRRETIERYYSMEVGNDDLTNMSDEEILNKIYTKTNVKNSDNNIILRILYKPNKSINTDYLYKLYEDLQEEGYEMVALVQDYMKRINPVNPTGEMRFDLANIVDEFKTFAIDKNIPVITASQLNRTAAQTIAEAVQKNKSDQLSLLGNHNIGESWGINENADKIILILKEYNPDDGSTYMSFMDTKSRNKRKKVSGSVLTTFAHPIIDDILLVDDYSLTEPKSIRSIKQERVSKVATPILNGRKITDMEEDDNSMPF